MRKLLSLLTVLTLTVPVPLNVIACGNKANPAPDVDDTDYLALKQIAEEKIHTEFANLVNDGSNLKTPLNFTDGNKIMEYLKIIKQDKDTNIKYNDSKVTIDGFLVILKEQVLAISTNLVDKYPELKPLFNGVNPNERLKINTDELDNLLTNKKFDWENNDFDLKTFKADDYGITDWYYLTANLTLDLTCLGEDAKINTFRINQTYDMYFANNDSKLNDVVSAVTANIKEKLDSIKFIQLNYSQWNDSFVKQQNNTVLPDINKKLSENTNLKTIKNLKIETNSIPNPYSNDYNYMNANGYAGAQNDDYPLTIQKAQQITDANFSNTWNPVIAKRETNFSNRLKEWKNKKNVPISDVTKVFVFGEYQTINWKIDDLEIKSLSLPYYITSDTTRTSNTDKSLAILKKLFAGPDALFRWGKNWTSAYNEDRNFNFALNSSVYDEFKNGDVLIQKIYDYVTEQTNNFGKDKRFIEDTDNVYWTTGGSTDWLNHSISTTKIPSDTNTKNWRLVINGNAFAMSIQSGQWNDVRFSITRSDTDVWPN